MNGFELRNLRKSVIQYDFFGGRLSHKISFPFAFVTVLFKGGAEVTDTRPRGCTLQ